MIHTSESRKYVRSSKEEVKARQDSKNCSILPSQMGEHGVSWENMEKMENTENMEKMENINQIDLKSLFMIQNTFL